MIWGRCRVCSFLRLTAFLPLSHQACQAHPAATPKSKMHHYVRFNPAVIPLIYQIRHRKWVSFGVHTDIGADFFSKPNTKNYRFLWLVAKSGGARTLLTRPRLLITRQPGCASIKPCTISATVSQALNRIVPVYASNGGSFAFLYS